MHFLHISKTGGTAIRHAISNARTSSDRTESLRYAIHLHRHPTGLRDVPDGDKVVFFLRDPVSRFVSAFYSRKRQGQPRYKGWWTEDEKAAFRRFHTPNHLACALWSPDTEERSSARAAMRNVIHVRDSYWKWFDSESYFLSRLDDLFFIGFQETLSDDFETLKSKLGLPRSVMLPDDDYHSHANPRNLDRNLQDAAVANLREWYEADFAFLDLCNRVIRKRPAIRAGRPRLTTVVRQLLSRLRWPGSRLNR